MARAALRRLLDEGLARPLGDGRLLVADDGAADLDAGEAEALGLPEPPPPRPGDPHPRPAHVGRLPDLGPVRGPRRAARRGADRGRHRARRGPAAPPAPRAARRREGRRRGAGGGVAGRPPRGRGAAARGTFRGGCGRSRRAPRRSPAWHPHPPRPRLHPRGRDYGGRAALRPGAPGGLGGRGRPWDRGGWTTGAAVPPLQRRPGRVCGRLSGAR